MAILKLKIKKTLMKRKIDNVTVSGYYGRAISSGKKTFEEIAKYSCKGTSLDAREAELAAKLLIDGISENLRQGFIVDLGVLGTLYPAVNGPWKTDPKELSLSELTPKVNYVAGEDIAAAIRGAVLQWTTEQETDENTVTDPDDEPSGGGSGSGTGTGGGGSTQTETTTYGLTITKMGSGTATVTSDGTTLASGATLSEDAEVEISITPASGTTPSATVNGSQIELSESDGTYTGSFAMPAQASTLVINTGSASGDSSI